MNTDTKKAWCGKRVLRNRMKRTILTGHKNGPSLGYLSETPTFYRTYLESLFQPGMVWDNYGHGPGKWQIDHIKELNEFDLTDQDQIKLAWHWTNLQPLWDEDHKAKTDLYNSKRLSN